MNLQLRLMNTFLKIAIILDTSQKESENSFPGVLHDVNDNVDTIEVSNAPVQNVPHLPGSEPSINNSAEGLRRSTRVRKAVDRYGAVSYV